MPSDVTFLEVKNAFQSIAGLESLTAADEFFLVNSLNRAVSRAYNESNSWPRYLVVGEERSIPSNIEVSGASEPNANGTYVPISYLANGWEGPNFHRIFWESDYGGYWKLYDYQSPIDYYVESTRGTPVTTNPWDADFNTGEFGDAGVSLKQVVQPIPYTETSKDNIGEFLRIHRSKPFSRDSALEFEFYVDSNGANIINLVSGNSDAAFVTYKKELVTGFNQDSTDIPSEFVDYIIYTALSDFYTGDGQTEKAALAAAQADLMLDREIFRVDKKMNNNTVNKRFSTYVSRQAR